MDLIFHQKRIFKVYFKMHIAKWAWQSFGGLESHRWDHVARLLCCIQIAGGTPIMDLDLIQSESRNKFSCLILEYPYKIVAARK